MDPLSITASCVGLVGTITALSQRLTNFVLIARDARRDIDGFSRELTSLGLCVSTLKDAPFKFPPTLQEQLNAVLRNCGTVIMDMEKVIGKYTSPGLGQSLKWSYTDRDEVVRLRDRLEAHKAVLEVTLELASLTVINVVKDDTEIIREDTIAIKAELDELKRLVTRLQSTRTESNLVLTRFLNDTATYTESVIDPNDNYKNLEGSYQGDILDIERIFALDPLDLRLDIDAAADADISFDLVPSRRTTDLHSLASVDPVIENNADIETPTSARLPTPTVYVDNSASPFSDLYQTTDPEESSVVRPPTPQTELYSLDSTTSIKSERTASRGITKPRTSSATSEYSIHALEQSQDERQIANDEIHVPLLKCLEYTVARCGREILNPQLALFAYLRESHAPLHPARLDDIQEILAHVDVNATLPPFGDFFHGRVIHAAVHYGCPSGTITAVV